MARVTQHIEHTPVPDAPAGGSSRIVSISRNRARRWAGVAAAGTAVAAAAIVTVAVRDRNDPSSPTSRGSGPDCLWTSDVDVPVLPVEELGGAPTPESVLTFERCDGEWTGNVAWSRPSRGGHVNPWAAGNAAVARCFRELGRERCLGQLGR